MGPIQSIIELLFQHVEHLQRNCSLSLNHISLMQAIATGRPPKNSYRYLPPNHWIICDTLVFQIIATYIPLCKCDLRLQKALRKKLKSGSLGPNYLVASAWNKAMSLSYIIITKESLFKETIISSLKRKQRKKKRETTGNANNNLSVSLQPPIRVICEDFYHICVTPFSCN